MLRNTISFALFATPSVACRDDGSIVDGATNGGGTTASVTPDGDRLVANIQGEPTATCAIAITYPWPRPLAAFAGKGIDPSRTLQAFS